MIKLIQDLRNELTDLKKGMETNDTKWTNQEVTAIKVKAIIDDLQSKDDDISAAVIALSKARTAGRDAVATNIPVAEQIVSLAEGIHKMEPSKLEDYNLQLPAARKAKVTPGKAIIKSIETDDNGEGFVIKFQSLTDAEGFEIEKSEPQNPDVLVLAPPFKHLCNSTRLSYIDEDVVKGKRYFYRGRGYNRRGFGEWSEGSSGIQ